MNTETITIGEIRAFNDDDAGIISGYASVFDVIDSYKSVIRKGSFIETLRDRQGKIRVCYNHENGDGGRPLTILGRVLNIYEDEHGLFVELQFNMEVEKAREVFSLVKHGDLNTFSIGFTVKSKGYYHKDGVRYITDVELYEISIVGFEANEKAVIDGVRKKMPDTEEYVNDERALSFIETVKDSEIQERLYNGLMNALAETLFDIRWEFIGDDEMLIQRADDAIRDFSEIYMDTLREWVRRRQQSTDETSATIDLDKEGSVAKVLFQLAQKNGNGISGLALHTPLSLDELKKLRQGKLIPGIERRLKEISVDLYDTYRKYRGQQLELMFSELRNGLLPAEKQRVLSLLGFQFEAEQLAIDSEESQETNNLNSIIAELSSYSQELKEKIRGL